MSDTKHTPTPWRIQYTGEDEGQIQSIVHGIDRTIVRPNIDFDHDTGHVRLTLSSCSYASDFDDQHLADMEFLIRAVNHHDELVEALIDCESDLEDIAGLTPHTALDVIDIAQQRQNAVIRILAKIKDAQCPSP